MRQIITLIIVLLRYMVMQAVMPGAPAAPVAEQPDTIVIIQGETVPAPDNIYGDESVVIERLAGDSTTVLTTSDYAAIASCGREISSSAWATPATTLSPASLSSRRV